MLERQLVMRAFSRACANTGKRMAASMAMIAITTSSSIRVKPRLFGGTGFISFPRFDVEPPRRLTAIFAHYSAISEPRRVFLLVTRRRFLVVDPPAAERW